MAVSRQVRRQMEKSQKGADKKRAAIPKKPAPGAPAKKRTSPMQFLREVRGELGRVSWPNRADLTHQPSWSL